MPIVAVAGAIGAWAIAGTAVAATASIAAVSAATAFSVVAAVGATIGAIGAVTRDKTLSMIGLGIGAVGGIGALAGSAGLLGSGPLFGGEAAGAFAETAGGLAGGGEGIAGFTAGVGDAASGIAGGFAGGGEGIAGFTAGEGVEMPAGALSVSEAAGFETDYSGVIDFLANQPGDSQFTGALNTEAVVPDPAAKLAEDASGGLADPGAKGIGFDTPGGLPSGPETKADAANVFEVTPGGDPGGGEGVTGYAAGTGPAGSDSAGTASDGVFGKIGDFAKKNPMMAYGVVQAAGSFLSGLGKEDITPAQVTALNAQAANNQAQANLVTQQTANIAAPKAIARSEPVTGAPQPIIPQMPIGLVNRPRLAPITGIPA